MEVVLLFEDVMKRNGVVLQIVDDDTDYLFEEFDVDSFDSRLDCLNSIFSKYLDHKVYVHCVIDGEKVLEYVEFSDVINYRDTLY